MIETKQLIIRPLTYSQLVKYAQSNPSLEVELNVQPSERSISPELKVALEQTILPSVADASKDYLYSTLWTAISKTDNKMVGELCMMGEPNEEGEIEIGYGTHEEFQGRGFMTEMVAGIIEWARSQEKICSILANTEKSNISSFRVLQKNQFLLVAESESMLHWKLVLK